MISIIHISNSIHIVFTIHIKMGIWGITGWHLIISSLGYTIKKPPGVIPDGR